jgi:hypothetical protein
MCPQFKSGPRHLNDGQSPTVDFLWARHCGDFAPLTVRLYIAPDEVRGGGSSNGRTTDFGSVNRGSNPCPPAMFGVSSYLLLLLEDRDWQDCIV